VLARHRRSLNFAADLVLAHAGHWLGGVGASVVILAIGIAVFVRERRGAGGED